jgi:hypothetical protein
MTWYPAPGRYRILPWSGNPEEPEVTMDPRARDAAPGRPER